MIETIESYGIKCDKCKSDFEDFITGHSLFLDKPELIEKIQNNGWSIIGDKHYCEECNKIQEKEGV